MRALFAPWRLEYVSSAGRAAEGDCIFCRAWESSNDRETLTLWRGERCFALLNRYPYTSGHAMVAPVAHVADLDDLEPGVLAEMMEAARALTRALKIVYAPHAFNLGMNVGEAAGAGIKEHLHLHVVPRWMADTNFISVVGDVRVIPENLGVTWEKVVRALATIDWK
ncbi:MAG TPA: HIT domain-containing protein [Acidobacteria bacterium]|nr:HIT domain-containing protein [Acidobacteriota bacterium]